VLSDSLEFGAFESAGSVLLNVFLTVGDIAERVSNRSPEHPTLPLPKVFGTAWAVLRVSLGRSGRSSGGWVWTRGEEFMDMLDRTELMSS